MTVRRDSSADAAEQAIAAHKAAEHGPPVTLTGREAEVVITALADAKAAMEPLLAGKGPAYQRQRLRDATIKAGVAWAILDQRRQSRTRGART